MRPSMPPVPTRGSIKDVKERFMKTIEWSTFGITVRDVFRNLHPAKLYEEAIRHEPSTTISSTGALIACSGVKTVDLQKINES
jgi:ATP-dependent phosphoenolpyruvate carboxykinase